MTEYTFHKLANIFRMMNEEEYNDLKGDIKRLGFDVKNPIILYEGTILDGRNRYTACKELEVEPVYEDFDESIDPVDYVYRQNLHRRHLGTSERAMAAARTVTATHGGDRGKTPIGALKPVTIEAAAEKAGVGTTSVDRAKRVLDHGIPELVDAVESDTIAVSAAAKIAELPPEEQHDAIEGKRTSRVTTNTGDNEWFTPPEFIEMAREVLGTIDLDPASNEKAQENVKATTFYTQEDDGLEQHWAGKVWLNPPYSQPLIMKFIEKLCGEYEAGNVTEAILLTNDSTDTTWYHAAAGKAVGICGKRGRIKFYKDGGEEGTPTQGQTFFYFGQNWEKFVEVFSEIGFTAVFE